MPLIKNVSTQPVEGDERGKGREVPDLVAQLNAPDPAVRRWAARDLATHPEAVAALIAHLSGESDVSVRKVMFTTLVRLNDPAAVVGMAALLRSEDIALRNEAVEALREFPDGMAGIIRELLSDNDPDVRIFGVNILESLRHPHVEKWLLELLARDPHVNVCAAAVDVLAEVGTELCRPPLHDLKKRFPKVPYLRFAIDVVLQRIGRA